MKKIIDKFKNADIKKYKNQILKDIGKNKSYNGVIRKLELSKPVTKSGPNWGFIIIILIVIFVAVVAIIAYVAFLAIAIYMMYKYDKKWHWTVLTGLPYIVMVWKHYI